MPESSQVFLKSPSDSFPKIMGILNVTPDSFSDGGRFLDPEAAYRRALQMEEQGADIIDIGGESTRPGAQPIFIDEEVLRVRPVLKRLAQVLKIPISIDTRHAAVARIALEEGASWINDVSALGDPDMASIARHYNVPIVLMHMKGKPQTMQESPHYEDAVSEVFGFLKNKIESAVRSMIKRENIIVDPGIGFGKRFEDNLSLFQNLKKIQELGCPVLIGFSRKRFVKSLFGESVDSMRIGNLTLSVLALQKGVQILRVHEVAETKRLVNGLKMGAFL